MASDVQGDAILLELDEITGGSRATVADVQLAEDVSWTFSAYARDLPLAAIEWLIGEARRRLPPRLDEV